MHCRRGIFVGPFVASVDRPLLCGFGIFGLIVSAVLKLHCKYGKHMRLCMNRNANRNEVNEKWTGNALIDSKISFFFSVVCICKSMQHIRQESQNVHENKTKWAQNTNETAHGRNYAKKQYRKNLIFPIYQNYHSIQLSTDKNLKMKHSLRSTQTNWQHAEQKYCYGKRWSVSHSTAICYLKS